MSTWITVALIGSGIILYTRLFVNNEQQQNQTEWLQSMEDTIEHFVMEIEEDNQVMIEQIRTIKEQFEQQNSKLLSRIEFLEQRLIEHSVSAQSTAVGSMDFQEENRAEHQRTAEQLVVNETAAASEHVAVGMAIKERYQQLFELHDAGKSVDYIAKKLAINRGEVQLIMQLGHQEELSRV